MKIAIFSDTFSPEINGVANVAFQSAQNLAEAGHEVLVCVPHGHSKTRRHLDKKFKILSLPSLPLLLYPGLKMAIPTGLALFRLFKNKFRPDIIHSHTLFGIGLEAVACAKILKIPLVGTHHTFYDHYLKHVKLDYSWAKKFSWWVTAVYYNFCDLVISPSHSLGQELNTHGLKKSIEYLPNSVNELFSQPIPSPKEKQKLKEDLRLGKKSLIYMGRISYEKNIHRVLQAFAIFLKEEPEATLMLAGDGPERKNLEKLALELKIKEKMIFAGFLNGQKLVQALQANDIFVTASKSENMPLSVLEAMAVGLPIVAVVEKGLSEIIKDGVNGFLVPTDQPELIAKKLTELARQPKLLKKFSQASQEETAKYSKEIITQKLINVYAKVIKNYENLSIS